MFQPFARLSGLGSPNRRPRLPYALEQLEGRVVPATAAFANGVLTVTATTNGDVIGFTSPSGNPVVGATAITANGSTIFDSGVTRQVPSSIVVRMNSVNIATLNVSAYVYGSLTVTGAKTDSTVTFSNSPRILGNFTYSAASPTGAAADTITWGGAGVTGSRVNGNMTLTLGGGANSVSINAGTVQGNLKITGGASSDILTVGTSSASGQFHVLGTSAISLGNGFNSLTGNLGGYASDGGFSYLGGTNSDTVDFVTHTSVLTTGGTATINMGGGGVDSNFLYLYKPAVGGSLTLTGGAAGDRFYVSGGMTVGTTLSLLPGNGTNEIDLGNTNGGSVPTGPVNIGGGVVYQGGTGDDDFKMPAGYVGKGL
ncbi:hypothetical protein, partial [Zavarzinella formosa]|uniref:hypothetical protein n=1 Tax=Zavarzinella formosa TaxID=360055 RepID=UPI00187DAC3D